jgi:hypothetical protein
VLQQPATDPQVDGKRQKAQQDATAGQDLQQPSFSGPGDPPTLLDDELQTIITSSPWSAYYKRRKRAVEKNPLALKSVRLDNLSRRERCEICTLALSSSRFDELSPHEQFKICRHVLSVWKLDASREREVMIGCIFAKFDELLPDDRWDLLADLRCGGGPPPASMRTTTGNWTCPSVI